MNRVLNVEDSPILFKVYYTLGKDETFTRRFQVEASCHSKPDTIRNEEGDLITVDFKNNDQIMHAVQLSGKLTKFYVTGEWKLIPKYTSSDPEILREINSIVFPYHLLL
ncbi:unnamed protein product [Gordionus sp. m RMFG-2023]